MPRGGRPMPSQAPWEWRLDTDTHSSQWNPRYIEEATPEPISMELAEQTRCELRKEYYGSLLQCWLRTYLKEAWLPHWFYIPRVPYLTDGVIFPHASQIKNGHILPARVRSYISGEPEVTSFNRDAFSTQRLEDFLLWTDDPSQIPDDDILLSRCAWLNQTTAIYFEPEFEERGPDYIGVPYIGRGVFAAWQEVNMQREEEPNVQQKRYFANPIMLLGGPKIRPITDIITTHRYICDALADMQDKPVSSKDPYSWVEHGAEMGVVYPSIIIVVDDARNYWIGKSEAESRDIMFKEFSVLLVRTGNEEHLSEPIDFSSLAGTILPLSRDELSQLEDKQQVIRVRLDTAVRFIMELERREQVRCPRLMAMKNILDEETFRDADKFAAGALAMAEENGSIDRNFNTWEAVRRARACLDGESFYVDTELAESDKLDYCPIRHWV
ncbi:hypothetical protein N8I77_012339 [Diaporthe amygdali]|uniref:Uncharacterized protein n=1 Tax=Phomopsis amygdali TaxID=1214568 RepID=A0AAD9S2G7_PHOAM|nr:hypothetical protein N8I77_012339 [Diaporthe amygdali]